MIVEITPQGVARLLFCYRMEAMSEDLDRLALTLASSEGGAVQVGFTEASRLLSVYQMRRFSDGSEVLHSGWDRFLSVLEDYGERKIGLFAVRAAGVGAIILVGEDMGSALAALVRRLES